MARTGSFTRMGSLWNLGVYVDRSQILREDAGDFWRNAQLLIATCECGGRVSQPSDTQAKC